MRSSRRAALACVLAALCASRLASAQEPKDEGEDEGEAEAAPKSAEAEEAKKRRDLFPRSLFSDVQADDWFTLASPEFELGGYYRVRTELFENFNLGRRDPPQYDPLAPEGTAPLWPRAPSSSYVDTAGNAHLVQLCGDLPDLEPCQSKLQWGANMRLRLEPAISVSDNVRIQAQIDMLDNVVMGSTPQGYTNAPSEDGGWRVVERGGYSPIGSFASTTWEPVATETSTADAIVVKRVWGEYRSPIGRISFGRMPEHWGLGMLYNAGEDHDADWQTNVDRLMFTYVIEDWHVFLAAAWDFPNEGPLSPTSPQPCSPPTPDVRGAPDANGNPTGPDDKVDHWDSPDQPICIPSQQVVGGAAYEQGGQPYDLGQLDEVDQFVVMIGRQLEEQMARRDLALGRPVIDAGFHFAYRKQDLANETTDPEKGASLGQQSTQQTNGVSAGYNRRGYEAVIGDLWLKFRFDKVRIELEAALHYGSLENTLRSASDFTNLRDRRDDGWDIRQFGFAAETEWTTLEDRLRLGFDFGFATGDDDVASLRPIVSDSSGSSLDRQLTLNRNYSAFSFHPGYRVDLILFRNILQRVMGAYYFRPSVDYDFLYDAAGQRAGAGLAVIWSRASEPVQSPGHAPDLGVELDFDLHYQLSNGGVSPDPRDMGGFFTSFQYGLLVPLQGLGYLPGEVQSYAERTPGATPLETTPAHIARWYFGVLF
jgi:hypothetical protein